MIHAIPILIAALLLPGSICYAGESELQQTETETETETKQPETDDSIEYDSSAYINFLPDVTPEMFRADYWISKISDPDEVRMSPDEIAEFNAQTWQALMDEGLVFDLDYMETMSLEQLSSLVPTPEMPENMLYHNCKETDEDFWSPILENAAVPCDGVTPGLCIRRDNLRGFPTRKNLNETDAEDEQDFDMLQDSAILPGEPVVIAGTSADGEWCYIYTDFCCGWFPADSIALCKDWEQWHSVQEPDEFLIVTGDRIILEDDPIQPEVSGLILTMGTRLPLVPKENVPAVISRRATFGNYVVKIPRRTEKGFLDWCYALIPMTEDVHIGYLPYTQTNVLTQAFKCLGSRYGWGGMYHSWDCSAFIMDVHRCFGLHLPRNSTQQSKSGGEKLLWEDTEEIETKLADLELIPAGSLLYLPGHIMFYLGQENGQPYSISAAGSFVIDDEIVNIRTVLVNPLSYHRKNGKTWLESLTVALLMTPEPETEAEE